MHPSVTSLRRFLPVLLVLAASCGGEAGETGSPAEGSQLTTLANGATDATTPPADTAAPAAPEPPTAPTGESCGAPATWVELETPVEGEVIGNREPPAQGQYLCVMIPDGVAEITFELSGMTADLDLFVGHPDFATLENGGQWFWFGMVRGTDNERVTIGPTSTGFVRPGPYYIEVSAEDFRGSSPFALSMTTG